MNGWTTEIVLFGSGGAGATLRWYRFSDGQLVHTQSVPMTSDAAIRVDPRRIPELADDMQYAVVATANGGAIGALALQLVAASDGMMYEGLGR